MLVSAVTGEGLELLQQAIDARLGASDEVLTLEVPAREGRLLSWLHANAEVLREDTADTGAVTTRIRIDPAARGKLESELEARRAEAGEAVPDGSTLMQIQWRGGQGSSSPCVAAYG